MGSGATRGVEGPRTLRGPLSQSEQVQDKVERAAVELSAVNEILKDELRPATSVAEVARALDQSEAVEEEIDQRLELERRLSHSDVALTHSRAEAAASSPRCAS